MSVSTKTSTLADEMKKENDLLTQRFIHHTRPKHPLSMEEAKLLHQALINSSTLQYSIEEKENG